MQLKVPILPPHQVVCEIGFSWSVENRLDLFPVFSYGYASYAAGATSPGSYDNGRISASGADEWVKFQLWLIKQQLPIQ